MASSDRRSPVEGSLACVRLLSDIVTDTRDNIPVGCELMVANPSCCGMWNLSGVKDLRNVGSVRLNRFLPQKRRRVCKQSLLGLHHDYRHQRRRVGWSTATHGIRTK